MSRLQRSIVSVLVILVGTSACSKREFMGRFLQDVREARDSLTEIARPVPRALVGEASQAIDDSLAPVVDSMAASLLTIVENRVGRMEDSLAAFVEADLRDALAELLRSNLALVRSSVDTSIDAWVHRLSTSAREEFLPLVDGELAPRAAVALDTMMSRAAAALARRLDQDTVLRRAVVNLADSVVSQAVRAAAREGEENTPWWVWGLGVGFGLIVLTAVGGFILKLKRALQRREDSLRMVALAIKERGDPQLPNRVRELAAQQGVEPWLHSYLEENGLLAEPNGGPREPAVQP